MTYPDDRSGLVPAVLLGMATTLVLVLLGVFLDWPTAIVVLLILVPLALTVVVVRRSVGSGRRPSWEPSRGPDLDSAPEPPTGSARIDPIPIPSATAGYRFELTATAHWAALSSRDPLRDRSWLSARACEAIVGRAAGIARQVPADDSVRVGLKLASELGTRATDRDGGIETWASDVAISLDEEDRRRLRALADITKDRQLTEHQRASERDLRHYLESEVLASTGSALIWWLARHIDDTNGAVAQIPVLARISATARDCDDLPEDLGPAEPTEPERARENDTPMDLRSLLRSLFDDEEERRTATRQLALLAEQWDRPDVAEAIREEHAGTSAGARPVAADEPPDIPDSDGTQLIRPDTAWGGEARSNGLVGADTPPDEA